MLQNGYQPKDREAAEFQRDRRKWRIRRRFAISSFVMVVLLTLFYISGPFVMDPEQAKTFSEFNSIVITLIGFFSSIVMLYMGAVTYSESTKDGVLMRDVKTS